MDYTWAFKILTSPTSIMNGSLTLTESCTVVKESESEVTQSCPNLCDPMGLHQAPPSMGFSRQEYWSGLPFPSPGNLPDPGSEPRSPAL